MVLAANRDEFYERQGEAADYREGSPHSFLAPRDPKGGGTWIGFNRAGVLVALTNRLSDRQKENAPSRGRLAWTLLGKSRSLEEARRGLEDEDPDRFNPFSLLLLDPGGLAVYRHSLDGNDRWKQETSGYFYLSNRNGFEFWKDPPSDFPFLPGQDESMEDAMRAFCSSHGVYKERDSVCLHTSVAGTLSSSLIGVDRSERDVWYQFAQGPPCENRYRFLEVPSDFSEDVLGHWDRNAVSS